MSARREGVEMSWWDSYRAVYGAELRAAAREFTDHGWPVSAGPAGLALITGAVLDVVEVPAECGRHVCALLRRAGVVVPVAATPSESWWFPVETGGSPSNDLDHRDDMLLHHTAGAVVLAPPSELPKGWVHWRVAPALTGYRLPPAHTIFDAVADAVRWRTDCDRGPGAQRPAPVVVGVGTRS